MEATPEWYDQNLTINAMAEKAGKTYDSVKAYLRRHHLPFKNGRICIPEWYDPNLTIPMMVERSGKTYNAVHKLLKWHHLPFKCGNGNLCTKIQDLSTEDMTVREIAEKVGTSRSIYRQMQKVGSKYIHADTHAKDVPAWYDQNLTAREMAEKSGKDKSNVIKLLKTRGLPYLKNVRPEHSLRTFCKADLMMVYSPELTSREMCELLKQHNVNVEYNKVHSMLKYYKLPFKLELVQEDNIPEWYDKSLTVSEMAAKSGKTEPSVRGILQIRKLPFKLKINKLGV